MRSLTVAGILVLAASVVACTDSLTGPEVTPQFEHAGAPECIHVSTSQHSREPLAFACGEAEPDTPGAPPGVYIDGKNVTGG